MEWNDEVAKALQKPFDPSQIKTKPGAGGQKLAFIDARDVHQRLDEVVGPGGWAFSYDVVTVTPTRAQVKGCLTVLGVTKCDAGEAFGKESEELLKAAVSDAIKRCAVLFGCGRHLYELGPVSGAVSEAQVAASARKAGYREPEPEALEPFLCTKCGKVVDDKKAQASLALAGEVFCGPHGRDWMEQRQIDQSSRAPEGQVT